MLHQSSVHPDRQIDIPPSTTPNFRTSQSDSCEGSREYSSKQPIRLDIIVPLKNESQTIALLRERLEVAVEQARGWTLGKIIFVDDGSTDDTAQQIRHHFRDHSSWQLIVHPANLGIAAAIRTAMAASIERYVCSIDADGTYDPVQINALVQSLEEGDVLVTASPYHRQGKVEGVPAARLWLSKCMSAMYGLATGKRLSCYTSCFRIYDRSLVVDLMKDQSRCSARASHNGFVGIAELICCLVLDGAPVREVPATLTIRRYGQSKMRIFQVGVSHLRFLARVVRYRFIGVR